jgi:nucleoside-diphosphate-sugar epimerase
MLEPILVTGATGFVGSTVSNLLRSAGFRVLTHARRPATGIDWVADLGESLSGRVSILCDVAAVVHCAAAVPHRSNNFARDNVVASTKLATALAGMTSLKRVVHMSSVAVYKRPLSGRWSISEQAEVVDGHDPRTDFYAQSKLASELALDAIRRRRSEVEVVHLRASSIYGPGMVSSTLLPVLVTRALRHEPMQLHGPRGYVQNFIHVSDVADLVVKVLSEAETPSVINAFSDDTYGLLALAELIRVSLDSRSQIIDGTTNAVAPEPVYINTRAKRLHFKFRTLAQHLRHAA